MPRIAKLVIIEGHQVVILPEELRFDVEQVYVRVDDATGDVVLSTRPSSSWVQFMTLRDQLGPAPDDFLVDK